LLEHGGKLRAAAARYNVPLDEWLDLSTGINPNTWQGVWQGTGQEVMPPLSAWARLPEEGDGLHEAACGYYGATDLLPVAGSQAAIQALPKMRSKSRVAVLVPSYNEHAHAWQRAGHKVDLVAAEQLEVAIDCYDVVVVVNPNNPTGVCFEPQTLLDWHQRLTARDGWLMVDEAFMDSTPADSLAACANRDGLIVLRSLGKFFGLAGARVGFVLASKTLLQPLAEELGPWAVSGPARWLATQALLDKAWHAVTRERLTRESARLNRLLSDYHLLPDAGTSLFQSVLFQPLLFQSTATTQAESIHEQLAQQGIFTRLFTDLPRLRFGLPADEVAWQRLQQALSALNVPVATKWSA
jgi:cobalamin biosynthetic protein CobC